MRYALRSLAKSPGFVAVTLLSLALGIGANIAIFGLYDALRLRPLPVKRPGDLVTIAIRDRHGGSGSFSGPHPDLTNPLWEQIREQHAGSGRGCAPQEQAYATSQCD